MSGKIKNAETVIYILIAVLLAYIFKKAAASPLNEAGTFHGLNYNLFVYIAAVLIAFVLYLVLMGLTDYLSGTLFWSDIADPEAPGKGSMLRRILFILYIAAAASVLILVYQIYVNENNLYPENTAATFLRQEVPHPVYFGVITLLSLVLLLSLKTAKQEEENFCLRFGLMPVFAFFCAVLVYCPNILKDTGAGTLHIHAVTNSVVNIMHGAPYGDLNCSIYGHYGLFLAPIAFLFGGHLNGIMVSLSVTAFCAFFAAFYAAHKLIRSNVVYVMTLCAATGTTTLLTRRGQYFQVNPLRLLWPALTLALIAYGISHTQTRRKRMITILEYVVGISSVIWNFETGLFCVLVIAVLRVYRVLYTDPLFSRHTFRTILLAVCYAVICLAGAFAIVGFYNVAAGGEFGTIKQFIYPLFSGTYNVNHLRRSLPSVSFLYFFEILLFLLTAFICLRNQAKHREGDRVAETVAFAVSLSGLASLIYFMNRAVYGNMSISHIQLCLLLGFYASAALKKEEGPLKARIGTPVKFFRQVLLAILFGCLVLLAVEGASYVQIACDFRVKSSWNTESIRQAEADLKEAVPENTFAFGTYVPELYAALGWDTGCHMTDWSDINEFNRNYALTEAQKHSSFLTSEELELPGYTVKAEIPVGEYTFRYYVKG